MVSVNLHVCNDAKMPIFVIACVNEKLNLEHKQASVTHHQLFTRSQTCTIVGKDDKEQL